MMTDTEEQLNVREVLCQARELKLAVFFYANLAILVLNAWLLWTAWIAWRNAVAMTGVGTG